MIYDPSISVLHLDVFDHDDLSADDLMGFAVIKLASLTPSKLQFHEIPLRLSDAAKKDKKCIAPMLLIKTHYFPCVALSEEARGEDESEGKVSEEASTGPVPVAGTTSVPDKVQTSKAACIGNGSLDEEELLAGNMGILTVKSLNLIGLQSSAGPNLVGEKIYLSIEAGNQEKNTVIKLNKAPPYGVGWMEGFYFTVPSTSHAFIRIAIMHKRGALSQGVGKFTSVVTKGSLTSKDPELAVIEIGFDELLGARGHLECSNKYFSSNTAHGEFSCVLEYRQSKPNE